ncbi:MAG: patatin-like phospholipase family protein [Planctomycetes bacterium]|nr:patatin-like phospholipase family protein [Planctomycetota bacterium]
MLPRATGDLALVMGGGGARAAYQAGLLRGLVRLHPEFAPSIVTGVSAGAINAACLASRAGPFGERVEFLVELWKSLSTEQVFRVDGRVLAANAVRAGMKLVSGGAIHGPKVRALVDTAPLRELLLRACEAAPDGSIPGIERNVAAGTPRAFAITAASYSTGQSITFVQGRGVEPWTRAQRRSVLGPITVDHVMASAALPIFFPAIEVGGRWYGDGGMRLTAPLSPAVHLGARRILAISTRYVRTQEEADRALVDAYPPPAQVLGVLFNSVFLDQFDADAQAMERINALLATSSGTNAADLRRLELCLLRPSRDLGRLANEHEPALPRAFRFMTRGLGTRETRSNDLLSLIMFQPDYLTRLIELGEQDAARCGDAIDTLFTPT